MVDAHVHMFPERLFRAVRAALMEAFGWQFEHGTDPLELWRFLSCSGVERFFLLNYAHKPGMSSQLNRWNFEVGQKLPAAIPFAAIHPGDEKLVDIAQEAVGPLGLAGFKLHLDLLKIGPDDASLFPIYDFAQSRGKPVVLHTGTGGSIHTAADLLTASRLRQVVRNFPRLRICVPHLGAMDTGSFFDLAEEVSTIWLDTAAVLPAESICHTDIDTSRLVRRLSRRVMFGSDFPNLAHRWEQEAGCIFKLGLDEAGLRRVLRDNALEFAGLA